VLLRLTSMRGVDLDLFDFDFDLTWMGFFINADEVTYGRYGGRDAESPDRRLSLAGLRHAMRSALRRHRECSRTVVRQPGATVEQFHSSQSLPATSCVHCHQVYDLRRRDLQAAGRWRREELWVYPLPENVGLTLDVDRGDTVMRVRAESSAAAAGLRAGDQLLHVNNVAIASFADLQNALHRAPAAGRIAVLWQRDGQRLEGWLELPKGWRQTDLSWRWSLRGVDPVPGVHGDDLTAQEKKALGLLSGRLAIRQGPFVPLATLQAGIRQNDVIVGVDGKKLEMTARQFGAFIRLHYDVGDRVTYNLLRGRQRIDVPFVLMGH
jgi:membrane-associated protease RseP (regulator of RpoE activity)